MSHEVIHAIADCAGPVVVATVTGLKGSAPRHLGTMMLFRPDGSAEGSVGGGIVELKAEAAALAAFDDRLSFGIGVEMVGMEAAGSEAICGGEVELTIEYVTDTSLYVAADKQLEKGLGIVLVGEPVPPGQSKEGGCLRAVLNLSANTLAGKAPEGEGGEAVAMAAAAAAKGFAYSAAGCFYSFIQPAEKLLILGGGHVGLAIARFAVELGFLVTVVDHRPEFAAAERFPEKVRTRYGDYLDIVDQFPFSDSTYVVIATPNHLFDLECVRAVLGKRYRYAGFVGSRRKTKMVLDTLIGEGFDRNEVIALHAPIGANIGAQTPAEIAVSILAEIIATRRGSPALAAMDADRIRRREDVGRGG
ncbi:MAG: XdhC family protein [Rectinemataceae bacterium]|nr:XdhC family protein [Rectinemataceae bacterium]